MTESGLIFIGAAMDDYLRAFDLGTGRELWKGRLPAGGQASPMSYEWESRQYVVIAAGGHGLMNTTPGDSIVAFALAKEGEEPGLGVMLQRPTPRRLALLVAAALLLVVIVAWRKRRTHG